VPDAEAEVCVRGMGMSEAWRVVVVGPPVGPVVEGVCVSEGVLVVGFEGAW